MCCVLIYIQRFENLKIKSRTVLDIGLAGIQSQVRNPLNHSFLVTDWNCSAFIHGKRSETKRAVKAKVRYMPSIQNLNCSEFRKVYGYDDYSISEEERNFPIAYNILLHKDFIQAEFLLRAIYRPQNYYCVHVDGFSPPSYHESVQKLADCFENVFIVSKTENVTYAGFSRLQADLNCMKDHLNQDKPWKYLLNIPGQQFPLKTNAEIVVILKNLKNLNNIVGITITSQFRKKLVDCFENKHLPPPHNVTIYKGSAYGVFSRQFVDWIINNKKARDLLKWCRDVYSPDEYYWATLNYNLRLHAPGSNSIDDETNPFLAVYVAWKYSECYGSRNKGYCTFSVRDLPTLVKRPEMFANKLRINYDALTLRCLGEWVYNKTLGLVPSGV
ncbi:hypothetical protein LOTGIDRAFT_173237 [Lottia gigantea]|uniref:Uncharacterized protein n=1 Tax=Lottia gigantea TaxID=225164 RepID=V4CEH5_LOTGI|nr:hypothetical protein LOTGIDRAFT_173237 [Lottia gigantea]ESP00335.1 hypothetical protein LOTGIDRAFT_173237 [Lottia gigantea]